MGNRRLYKIEHFHTLGTSESERLKVTALNLFHLTASPRLPKDRFLYVATQPLKGGACGALAGQQKSRNHGRKSLPSGRKIANSVLPLYLLKE